MKKLFLVCFAAMIGFMNAQETTEVEATGLNGAWWGMGQLQYSDDEATDTSTFVIMPIVGTFISPTVTVGAGVGYQSVEVGDADAVDQFVIMPLARKYWGLADNFYIFGQAAVPMSFYDGGNNIGFQLAPGVDYFLSSHFTVEATFGAFGYNSSNVDEGDSVGQTNLGFNMSDLKLGLKYIF